MLWCADTKLTRRFTLPAAQIHEVSTITRDRRVELLGQSSPTRTRRCAVASPGGLLLLYAQPISRVVRLTLDDIVRDDDQVLIRLGDPSSAVPQPFAAMLLDYVADRANMRTATNPGSTWLFPGRRANQPLRPEHLAGLVHELGVPTVPGRGAAIRQHVVDMSAPLVADALGYHHVTTTRLAAQAGTTWSRYAPGDH